MRRLVPHTTFKLEAMVYMTELFPSDELVGDANTGWKPILGRKFDDYVTSDDILAFVNDACNAYKSRKELKFVEFDRISTSAALFTKYKCTVDENNLGFIIRTKTELRCENIEEAVEPKWYQKYLPYGLAMWTWNAFKQSYNGMLDILRIG